METILSRRKCDKLFYAWRWVWHEICMGMTRSMHIGSGDEMCLWKCGLHGVNTKYFTYEWTISLIYLCTFFYIHVCICSRIYIVHTLGTACVCECECDRVYVCTCACVICISLSYIQRETAKNMWWWKNKFNEFIMLRKLYTHWAEAGCVCLCACDRVCVCMYTHRRTWQGTSGDEKNRYIILRKQLSAFHFHPRSN